MSEADNKAIIRRFIEEGLNRRNAALIDEIYSADYTGHDPERPAPRNLTDLKQGMAGLLGKVFPDAILHRATHGRRRFGRMALAFRATHQGEIMGIPATGKQISFGGMNLFRLENGKVVENWVYRDAVGMMRQLGALPTPS